MTGPCGDTVEIALRCKGDMIIGCTFDTDGCGATVACSSIVTEMTAGMTIARARSIDQKVILDYCNGLPEKNRHCALLAAETLQSAIDDYSHTSSAPWKRFYRTRR